MSQAERQVQRLAGKQARVAGVHPVAGAIQVQPRFRCVASVLAEEQLDLAVAQSFLQGLPEQLAQALDHARRGALQVAAVALAELFGAEAERNHGRFSVIRAGRARLPARPPGWVPGFEAVRRHRAMVDQEQRLPVIVQGHHHGAAAAVVAYGQVAGAVERFRRPGCVPATRRRRRAAGPARRGGRRAAPERRRRQPAAVVRARPLGHPIQASSGSSRANNAWWRAWASRRSPSASARA